MDLEKEEKEVKKGLTETRNNLQAILADGRKTRADIRIDNLKSHKEFLQKIGDLSFTFGAAIIPILLATRAKFNISHIGFIFAGVFLYIINGMYALLRIKGRIEKDGNDAPHIALDEEIQTYPVINAINKLLFELNNEDYKKEYISAQATITDGDKGLPNAKVRTDITLDIAVTIFVLASLLVARSAWPFNVWIFWLIFAVLLALIVAQAGLSYIRSRENTLKLESKREKLRSIRDSYQEWYRDTVLKRKK